MDDENNENIDSLNDAEDTENVNEEEVADTDSEETGDNSTPKYTENEKKLYARMKKAEKEAKEAKELLAKKETPERATPVSDLEKLVDAKLEKRELESLDLSDSLKKEVQTYAKIQGVSIKKALQSEYISFLKEKEDKEEKIDNASLGSKSRKSIKKDYSRTTASDFNLNTPEGRAEFTKYEEYLREKLG